MLSSQRAVGDLEDAPRQRREIADAHEADVGGAGDGLADVQARRDPGGVGRRGIDGRKGRESLPRTG
jgi:hypothetical protein